MSSPIADLSYRHYEGVLEPPRHRWWAIAKTTMRQAFRKKVMWVVSASSAWYYLGMVFVMFVLDQIAANRAPNAPDPMEAFLLRIVWKDQFLHGFGFGQILFLLGALILGAGTIANDTRANALLVYLSKPVTKRDYLLGKWFGVFLPLLAIMLIPSLAFFLFGLMSYREKGFVSQDPLLFLKLLLMFPLGAAFHASLVIGFSSMFNQGRLAGATYAALYFVTNFFTQAMVVVHVNLTMGRGETSEAAKAALPIVHSLYYASVDGLNIGMAKAILGTAGSPYFGIPSRMQMVPAPPLLPVLAIMVGLSALMLFIAWRRIRAVEVVG
ncbi:MAG: ABC transporter permease subunit [Methanoregulaceae archaeon]|jgi:ABC-2 type transport system permease protein|nr:ABC transporter permease subunit [Methanoregulaceae archaeon]